MRMLVLDTFGQPKENDSATSLFVPWIIGVFGFAASDVQMPVLEETLVNRCQLHIFHDLSAKTNIEAGHIMGQKVCLAMQ